MNTLLRQLACVLALASGAALGQYPTQPLRVIVPFPPGGSTDVAARLVMQPVSKALGQPVVIENLPGGDGVPAAEVVARAAPDGYTLFLATASAMSFAPVARRSLPYDPAADFTAVGRIGTFGFFLYAHPSVPAGSVGELISHARATPAKLRYGSSSATSLLMAAQFAQTQQLQMTHVPYAGDAPLVKDIADGRVEIMFAAGTALPQVREGRLKVLATTLPERSPLAPQAPTWAETGMPRITVTPWAGLFGPARLPQDVVQRLNRALQDALHSAEVREGLARLAFAAQSSSPEELAVYLKEQLQVWRSAWQASQNTP